MWQCVALFSGLRIQLRMASTLCSCRAARARQKGSAMMAFLVWPYSSYNVGKNIRIAIMTRIFYSNVSLSFSQYSGELTNNEENLASSAKWEAMTCSVWSNEVVFWHYQATSLFSSNLYWLYGMCQAHAGLSSTTCNLSLLHRPKHRAS